MRGENRWPLRPRVKCLGSSPHARGKHWRKLTLEAYSRLIPACAGKTMPTSVISPTMTAHPRMRGETPAAHGNYAGARAHPRMRGENIGASSPWRRIHGSSPHARGKLNHEVGRFFYIRLIPACAGKTTRPPPTRLPPTAHPRMRGENITLPRRITAPGGSSPHARGKQRLIFAFRSGRRLIPACAGKTRIPRGNRFHRRAHPRMRGENWPG